MQTRIYHPLCAKEIGYCIEKLGRLYVTLLMVVIMGMFRFRKMGLRNY